ncbi:helix-turn-helix domain-containing protein [Yinghuangia sp. YIM S10712]|uniref:helix-turn-helix domain-containing protein n=1 Tax=Yinghuangia sp. YIM S10712 TaxID=3436930 RepID=UPI003F53D353
MKRHLFVRQREAQGFTQESLAEELGVDRTTIARWETGRSRPQPWMRRRLAAALDVTNGELDRLLAGVEDDGTRPVVKQGGTSPTDKRGSDRHQLTYHRQFAAALDALLSVAEGDVDRSPSVRATAYEPEAVEAACLDWLVTTVETTTTHGSITLTAASVGELHSMTETFDALDRQFGGDQSRELAARYLRDRVVPRLREAVSPKVRTDYFQAASVLTELIGWMAYDSGRHGTSQRYFVQALRLAEAAGDRAYGGYILTSMSDQALYLKKPVQALRLARAASEGVARSTAPAVATEAALLEARSLAALGYAEAAEAALGRADAAYERTGAGDSPTWAVSFNEIVFTSHVGACWADLGHAERAAAAIEVATAQPSSGQSRRRVFGLVQQANVALLRRDVEAAAGFGTEAATIAGELNSARSRRHVEELVSRMEPWSQCASVQAFADHARGRLGMTA